MEVSCDDVFATAQTAFLPSPLYLAQGEVHTNGSAEADEPPAALSRCVPEEVSHLLTGASTGAPMDAPMSMPAAMLLAGVDVPAPCRGSARVVANYYQTLDGDVLGQQYTHWYAAALHFGTDEDGSPYIHWNDWQPDDPRFRQAWADLRRLKEDGASVLFMLGGAGGAFSALFRDFETYYALLRDFVRAHPCIDGLDLDVEERVDIDDLRMLIRQLDADFGPQFLLTMAPLASSLATDSPGLGGFVYKDLVRTAEGLRINWFNGQFYGPDAWDTATLDAIVANGYAPDKIVMGMLYADFPTPADAHRAFDALAQCQVKHPNLKGAYVWEHALAPLGPREWAAQAARALTTPRAPPAQPLQARRGGFCVIV